MENNNNDSKESKDSNDKDNNSNNSSLPNKLKLTHAATAPAELDVVIEEGSDNDDGMIYLNDDNSDGSEDLPQLPTVSKGQMNSGSLSIIPPYSSTQRSNATLVPPTLVPTRNIPSIDCDYNKISLRAYDFTSSTTSADTPPTNSNFPNAGIATPDTNMALYDNGSERSIITEAGEEEELKKPEIKDLRTINTTLKEEANNITPQTMKRIEDLGSEKLSVASLQTIMNSKEKITSNIIRKGLKNLMSFNNMKNDDPEYNVESNFSNKPRERVNSLSDEQKKEASVELEVLSGNDMYLDNKYLNLEIKPEIHSTTAVFKDVIHSKGSPRIDEYPLSLKDLPNEVRCCGKCYKIKCCGDILQCCGSMYNRIFGHIKCYMGNRKCSLLCCCACRCTYYTCSKCCATNYLVEE